MLKVGDIIRHKDTRSKLVFEIVDIHSTHNYKPFDIKVLKTNNPSYPVGEIHSLSHLCSYIKICNYNSIWFNLNV